MALFYTKSENSNNNNFSTPLDSDLTSYTNSLIFAEKDSTIWTKNLQYGHKIYATTNNSIDDYFPVLISTKTVNGYTVAYYNNDVSINPKTGYFKAVNFAGAFDGEFEGNFSGDFDGNFTGYAYAYGNFTGDFTGDFDGDFEGHINGYGVVAGYVSTSYTTFIDDKSDNVNYSVIFTPQSSTAKNAYIYKDSDHKILYNPSTNKLTVGGPLDVTGATTLNNTLSVTGDTTLGGKLNVTSKTSIGGGLTVTRPSTFTGRTTHVNGILTKDLEVTYNTTIGGDLEVDDDTTVNGTLGVVEDVGIGKTLRVDGATTLNGAVTLGDAEDDAITVNGDTRFKADVDIDKTLNVDGKTTLKGTLTVTRATTLNGAVTLGDAEDDAITVNGDTRFKADVDIDKTLNVDGKTTLQGVTYAYGNTFIGNNELTDKLTINSIANFNGNAIFHTDVTIGESYSDALTINSTTFFDEATAIYNKAEATYNTGNVEFTGTYLDLKNAYITIGSSYADDCLVLATTRFVNAFTIDTMSQIINLNSDYVDGLHAYKIPGTYLLTVEDDWIDAYITQPTSTSGTNGANKTKITINHKNSAVSAGYYGPDSGPLSPGFSGSFKVPYFSVDAKGHVNFSKTQTITMPTQSHHSGAANANAYTTITNNNVSVITGVQISATGGLSGTTKTLVHGNVANNTGNFGPSSGGDLGFGDTFKVPYVTVNSQGHVTKISTKEFNLPVKPENSSNADNATNANNATKVTVNVTGSSASYPVLLGPAAEINSAQSTGSKNVYMDKDNHIYYNPSANSLTTGTFYSTSDINVKSVLSYDLNLSVEDIANAPTIKFTWKDSEDKSLQIGSIAQYWENILPESVSYNTVKTLNYSVLGTISGIINSREIISLRNENKELKDENRELKNKYNELEARLSLLEKMLNK